MNDERRATPLGSGAIVGIGLAVIGFYVVGVFLLMGRTTYDTWGAMLIAPLLFLVTLPALAKQAAREGDRRLFWLLAVALLLKMCGALARTYVAFGLYGGRADVHGYYGAGYHISQSFLQGDFTTGLKNLTGTNFINLLTGIVFTITRPTLLGGMFIFSWLGFVGMFLFYRAFVIAVPEGRSRTYARLLFFLPSMLFWPSSIGKEAWMVFAMGVAAFGIARILTDQPFKGFAIAVAGLLMGVAVRPHIPGMMALGLVFAYLFRRSRVKHREFALVVKGLTLVVLVVLAGFLVVKTQQFLNTESLTAAISSTAQTTAKGGSEFNPATLLSPTQAPLAIITVLYRPLLIDAHNAQALLAALEGTFLFGLSLKRIRWIWSAVRSFRRQPYVAFAAAYMAMFIVAFSSFANFGLLSRERVQLLPLFFVFLSIPPRAREPEQSADDALVAVSASPY